MSSRVFPPHSALLPHFSFMDVLVDPELPIYECPTVSGLDESEVSASHLNLRELVACISMCLPPYAVIAMHDGIMDMGYLETSLCRGQVIDTGRDLDVRELASRELGRGVPRRAPFRPGPTPSTYWDEYCPDAQGSPNAMSLAALTYLFTGKVLHRRGAHSSFMDCVATLGIARMVVELRNGRPGTDRSLLGSGPILWTNNTEANRVMRGELGRLVLQMRREPSPAAVRIAFALWESFEDCLRRLQNGAF